ncbi:hypothetical protein FML15_09945 [Klebsiella michiganensis]|nr:hypothetical protein C2U44_28500 [Klebsiella oxytoca]MBZ6860872.1 hypothetical protein [Klebsiella michiganensis]MBZ7217680.1 hypothetical protein [Klebsiella michiganensis]MBZ7266760.1 hypothetical protein [Klebsiella michiganensis]MBZ7418933.1 hypothetical protein [Klebsiella michiganensis]
MAEPLKWHNNPLIPWCYLIYAQYYGYRSLDQVSLLSVGQMRADVGEKWRKLDAVGIDGGQA